MKKIFFIIYSLSTGGGSEALLTTIINHLDLEKYEIGIMEIIHDTIKKEPIDRKVKLFPYYVEMSDPERKAKMYYVYHEWNKVIEEYIPLDYDLYISFNYLRPVFLLPQGKRAIAWINEDVRKLEQPNLTEERELQNESFYKTDRIVAISDIVKKSLLDLFPEHKEKIRTIYNGVDIKTIQKKAKEPAPVQLQHPAILCVGRLDANKNPLRMLDIFDRVHKKNEKAHLYYLGYGELEDAVRQAAFEKEIYNQVHLLGYCENPFPIIAQSDVNTLVSVSESFGLAIAEGLCLGIPFVGTDVGALRALSDEEKCGRIITTDAEAASAILELLEIDKEKIAAECYKSIERYGIEFYIHQIEELFDEVLKLQKKEEIKI